MMKDASDGVRLKDDLKDDLLGCVLCAAFAGHVFLIGALGICTWQPGALFNRESSVALLPHTCASLHANRAAFADSKVRVSRTQRREVADAGLAFCAPLPRRGDGKASKKRASGVDVSGLLGKRSNRRQ